MEISALTLKLIILLIPGFVAATIYKQLTIRHRSESDFMFVLKSIMLGIFSYFILQMVWDMSTLFVNTFHSNKYVDKQVLQTFQYLSDENSIPYGEMIWSSVIGLILGFLFALINDRAIIFKLAKKLRITNKYGNENLFTNFLNDRDIEWVYVRDTIHGMTYLGNVRFLSEAEEFKEIVLSQVTVYNYPDSEYLYDIPKIYLCLPKDNVKIEKAIENAKET